MKSMNVRSVFDYKLLLVRYLFFSFLYFSVHICAAQIECIPGEYYNGYGTDLKLLKNGTFEILHTPKDQICVIDVYHSKGIWTLSGFNLILKPELKDPFPKIKTSDSLNIDSMYFQLYSSVNNESLPFAELIFLDSSKNKLYTMVTNFDGKATVLTSSIKTFDSILISYAGFKSVKILKNDISVNYIQIGMVEKFEHYLSKQIVLEQKSKFRLKIISGELEGNNFHKVPSK